MSTNGKNPMTTLAAAACGVIAHQLVEKSLRKRGTDPDTAKMIGSLAGTITTYAVLKAN